RPPRWHIIPDVAFASDPNHTDRVRTGQRSGSRWLRREPGAPGRQHYRLRALRIRDRGDVRFQIHQLGCVSSPAIGIGTGPAQLDPDIVAVDPAELLEALLERRDKGLPFGIPLQTAARQETDPTHLIGLLRLRHERPRRRRASDERDEVAPLHVEHEASPPGKPAPIPLSQLTAYSACRRAVGESLGQTLAPERARVRL